MGLDMYLERRKELSNNGGSCYNLKTNPLVRTVEITSVGYWRKAYDLDQIIADATQTDVDDNCRYIYIDEDAARYIIEEVEEQIETLKEELSNLKQKLNRKNLNEDNKKIIETKIDNIENWNLDDLENAKEVFSKVLEEYAGEDGGDIDFWYHRWY